MASPVRVSREHLHARVWADPMVVVAQDLGISDVALKKHCDKLNVPVPGRGYWQRKAAGFRVRVKPLPKASIGTPLETEIVGRIVDPVAEVSEAPNGLVHDQEEFESLPANLIRVGDALRKPHPLVRKTSDWMKGAKRRAVGDYSMPYVEEPTLDIDVSHQLLARALRIMDALVKALERRGFPVACGTDREPMTYTTILGQKIPFGIRETLKRGEPEMRWGHATQTLEHTGKLALVVRHTYGRSARREWKDTKQGRIEEDLNDFIVLLVAFAVHEKERHDEFLREEAEREVRRKREREAARLAAIEAAWRKQLRADASDWAEAARLREFLAAVEHEARERAGAGPLEDEFAAWLDWARKAADAIDPLRAPELQVHFAPAIDGDTDWWRSYQSMTRVAD